MKICGLQDPVHAAAAAAAGADLLGFVFAPARRQVTPEVARRCIAAARETASRSFLVVGVFVDASAREINGIAEAAELDLVQLHGDEPPPMLNQLIRPVVKGLRPRPGTPVADVDALADRYQAVSNPPIAFLVDGFASHAAGGTAVRADWELARNLAQRWPLILAGGLDPDNVARAVSQARPLGVDVSSGVETHGAKDPEKIAAFVAAARRALTGRMRRLSSSGVG